MRLLVGYTNQMPEVAGKHTLPGRETAGDEILAFGAGYAHLNVTPDMEWRDILAQCPDGWTPDVYIHWSPEYNPIPAGLERAECLTVGVFGDWNLGGQAMRAVGGLFDVLVADRGGCERLRNMGFTSVLHSLLWAHEPDKHRLLDTDGQRSPGVKSPAPGDLGGMERDIDILMIGNFNHAIQWERAAWLARVARLSTRYKVVLTSGVYGDEYVRLMNRAKIVFNRSIRGEANMRAYEAPACGALMFYETDNQEIRDVYADREHCVLYDETNLEYLLDYYLAPENRAERERIARNGRERVALHSYAHHFANLLNSLEPWIALRQSGSLSPRPFRQLPPAQQALQIATHWLLTCNVGVYAKAGATAEKIDEPGLVNDGRDTNVSSLRITPYSSLLNFKAVLAGDIARCAVSPGFARQNLQRAIRLARQAVQAEPEYVLAQFNLASLYLAAGHASEGEKTLLTVLEQLQTATPATRQLLGVVFPRCYQWFDVVLERIYSYYAPESDAWREQMQTLLCCHIHLTLAEVTFARGQFMPSLAHADLATAQIPALSEAHYARACALRALGRVEDAIAAYRQTLQRAPFHVEARDGLARLCLDVERIEESLAELDEWLAILSGCPVYAHLLPSVQTLRRQAQAMQRQQPDAGRALPDPIMRLLAFPDWNCSAAWQALLRAFSRAYMPEDPVLLMLRADPATHPDAPRLLRQMEQFLRCDLGITADRLPNITLLHQPLPSADCWKLLHVADALIADPLPAFWRDLAQARCLPILSVEQVGIRH